MPTLARAIPLIPVLLVLCLSGCSHEPRFNLIHEDTVSDLYALKCLSAACETRTTLVPTQVPDGPEVRLAVHSLGDGSRERTVVLVHGVFTDHTTWRFMQGLLAQQYNVLVVDLPGCGDSDKPPPAADTSKETVYATPYVARRILQAVEAATAGWPPGEIAIVGHSYGGLVSIRMFADDTIRAEHARLLSRVDRLILFSPVDAEMNHPDPMFEQLVALTGFQVSAGLALGKIQDVLAEATLRATPENSPALHEEYHKRLDILREADTRRGLQALVFNALSWNHDKDAGFRPNWPAMEAITSAYAKVDVPILILWGARDEILPLSMGYKLAAQLPHAKLIAVPGAMHSLQIERPRYAAELIEKFVGSPSMADEPAATTSASSSP